MQPRSYDIHLLYDPTKTDIIAEKDALMSKLTNKFATVRLLKDTPLSFLETGSPFLAGEVHYQTEAPFAVLEWLAIERGSLDVLLVPQTCCGALVDHMQHALWVGRSWPLNVAALEVARPSASTGFLARALDAQETLKHDFVLHVVYASMNKWQSAAVETFLSTFASEFGLKRQNCTSSSSVEPSYDRLCMMGETTSPEPDVVQATAHAGIFVPKADVARVLSWAMTHRGADVNGYQVDLVLAPMTGNPGLDFTDSALHVGTRWPVHEHALN